MLDEHQELVANLAGNVIFERTEEISVECVNFDFISIGIIGTEERITKRQQSVPIIEIIPEHRVFVLKISGWKIF